MPAWHINQPWRTGEPSRLTVEWPAEYRQGEQTEKHQAMPGLKLYKSRFRGMLHVGQLASSAQCVVTDTVYHILRLGPYPLWAAANPGFRLFTNA